MSFFEDASLVLIPSGYKASKVYSVKPTDGTGDLTFTRSLDTATRVGADGLIEKVRTNICLQSQTIDNATSWSNTLDTGATLVVTANHAAAPNGTTTAERIQIALNGSSYAQRNQFITLAAGGEFTYSVFLKSLSGTPTIIFFYDNVNNITATLTNDWVRYTHTFTSTGNVLPRFVLEAATSSSADFLAWGCQLETGVATPYIPTTTAAVSVGMLANVPRLDYLGGGCPRLLLEPQRVNLQLNSEDFSQANWSKTNTTIVVNQLASPDGFVNSDKLNETAVNNIHQLESTRSVVAATQYTMSVFAKKAERSIVRIYEDTNNNGSYFDLNNGTLLALTGPTASAKIEDYSNGWYRCSVTYTETGTSGRYRILVTNANNVTSYLGVAGNGIYIYGAQYELGSYATSYIPTLGAAVTRSADAASKTGISALIGQTEGTLFVEMNVASGFDANNLIITASDGTSDNMIFINRVAGKAEYYISAGGVQQAAFVAANVLSTGVHKLAIAYKANDFAFFVDGVLLHSDTSGSVPACSRVNVGSYIAGGLPYNDGINQTLLFKTRLTNAQLAELTA